MDDDQPCTDCGDEFGADHFGPTSAGTTDKPWDGSASRFSDAQYKMATAACDPGDSPPKTACFLPHHEPGGQVNVNGVHAAAQRASSLKGHDAGAVSKAKAHLRSHYAALKEDPPDSIAASAMAELAALIEAWDRDDTPDDLAAQFAALHESYTGSHSHPHSAYGQQGDDDTHDHAHAHQGDNLHRHDHAAASTSPVAASGRRPTISGSFRLETPPGAEGNWENVLAGMAFMASGNTNPDPMLGSSWAVKQDGDNWHVLTAGGVPWTATTSYAEALDAIAHQLAESGDTRPVLADGWKSEMAFEGVSTGDGRFIEPGAIGYRDCPLPLMLQTETEPGHMGAVLAGAIMNTGKIGQIAIGAGDFDATDAGRQFVQIIQARGKFGVSIDVAEAEGAPQCETHGTDLEACDMDCNWETHFSLITVMGLTGTPFPAFQDAYIEMTAAAQPAPAPTAASGITVHQTFLPAGAVDGLHLGVITEGGYRPGGIGGNGPTEPLRTAAPVTRIDAGTFLDNPFEPDGRIEFTTIPSLTAAAEPGALPPRDWFTMPDMEPGDPRLVRQPNGDYAVPLTVEEPDPANGGLRRVYGHVAPKNTCHTGITDRCVTAPLSKTGYAAFNLRPVMTAEGDAIHIGHLTMGVGHADTDPRLPLGDVRAHYDGGPGAIRMAHVAAGHDPHGPWVAGYIEPAATDEQVDAFLACSLSGDWREVWKGKGLELFAVLAGVTVPGFPIASLAAAGFTVPAGAVAIGPQRIGWRNDVPVALVAAGVVRQPLPWERHIAALERDNSDLADRLERLERAVAPLRPLAAERLQAQMSGTFATPTKQDAVVSAALNKLLSDAHAAMTAQDADPDAATDPDDAQVRSHLKDMLSALNEAIIAQSRDGQEDQEPAPAAAGAK
jgi:hypothetical protein